MATPTGNTKKTKKNHQLDVKIPITASEPETYENSLGRLPEYDDLNDNFSAEQELYVDPMDENMDQRVHLAQERLSRLRKEAEEIEREKSQLEDLRRKQQGFIQGRTEMMERLSRAIALLDRETQDNRRKVEQMHIMRETFAEHMDAVHGLTPEDWNRQNLQMELSRALGIIEDARLEYDRSMTRLQSYTQSPVAPPVHSNQTNSAQSSEQASTPLLPVGFTKDTFKHWAFCGLAFTSPLLLLGVLALIFRALF